jgi:cellulose biosynthesis protein BcsQ
MVSSLRVVTVASNKGGVGKTTVATNLAVYLRALREELPILVLGLDDQDVIQRMFALDAASPAGPDVLDALRSRALAPAIRLGQYGVHYVPPCPTISDSEAGLDDPSVLRALLVESGWQGLVVIDTKSDLGLLTQSALAASDLTLIVVADQTSLDQAERIYALLDRFGKPRAQARILLSLVDRRVKFRAGEDADILALLLSEIRRRGYPCLGSFLSRSPKIESLYTNRERRAHSILHGAQGSLVHRQMTHLASDVLDALEAFGAAPEAPAPAPACAAAPAERRREERRPFARRIAGFSFEDPPILALHGRDLSPGGIALEPNAELARAGRVHLALAPLGGGERLLVWARVVRRDADRLALRFEIEGDAELQRRLRRFVTELDRAPAAAVEGRASA